MNTPESFDALCYNEFGEASNVLKLENKSFLCGVATDSHRLSSSSLEINPSINIELHGINLIMTQL